MTGPRIKTPEQMGQPTHSTTLTRSQQRVFDFIKRFIAKKGYGPSYNEMCEGLGLNSSATVHKHINTLVRKGRIRHLFNQGRSLEVVPESGWPDNGTSVMSKPLADKIVEMILVFMSLPDDEVDAAEWLDELEKLARQYRAMQEAA